MGNGTDLRGLALAVEEAAEVDVIATVADGDARIPELLCVGLVSDVAQHAGDLAVFDFVEKLAAELEVVALLIN